MAYRTLNRLSSSAGISPLRRSILLVCMVIVVASVPEASCRARDGGGGAVRLTIATGTESGPYYALGQALAKIYGSRIPNTTVSVQSTPNSMTSMKAVEEGRADLGFVQEDVAYFATRHGLSGDRRPFTNVRAVAALDMNAMQVVVPRDSPMYRLADLRGRRLAVSVVSFSLQVIQAAQGLEDDPQHRSLGLGDVVGRMQRGEIEGAFVVSSYPVAAIARLNATIGVRLLPIDRKVTDLIRARYPFFRPVVIPADTYAGQKTDIPTIGVGTLMVCRADLADELVYQLTRLFIESLSGLASVHPPAMFIDPEDARVTVLTLHRGAAWFYRERELFG